MMTSVFAAKDYNVLIELFYENEDHEQELKDLALEYVPILVKKELKNNEYRIFNSKALGQCIKFTKYDDESDLYRLLATIKKELI